MRRGPTTIRGSVQSLSDRANWRSGFLQHWAKVQSCLVCASYHYCARQNFRLCSIW
jgi:hypothetical protein